MITRAIAFCLLLSASVTAVVAAHADTAPVLTIWRLLDYMAIDYRGAVRDGTVTSASEYAEMVEFAGSMKDRLDALPPSGEKARRVML